MTARILIIDDDATLLQLTKKLLARKGYEVVTAESGVIGLEMMGAFEPHLVLLDIMMPLLDGWETCRRLREASNVPIIMLTARGATEDVVKGLRLGADDYVVEPVDPAELHARVEAVLRRSRVALPLRQGLYSFNGGRLVIDEPNRRVSVDGAEAELTPTEFNLLLFMAKHPGRILTTEIIFDQVWPYQSDAGPEAVKWYVWRLRRKIEPDPSRPTYIRTERGIGYRFADG